MPFTVSHAAAVLPLRRTGLPMPALVIGSMVPDLPLFGLAPWPYERSHSPIGLVTVDLLAGALLTALWVLLLRDASVDLAPRWVRRRVPPRLRFGPRDALLAVPAVVIGATTHVGWDSFTHVGRWGVRHVDWLAGQAGPLPRYEWAQYLSGVLGLAALALDAVRRLRASPPHQERARAPRAARRALGALLLLCPLILVLAGLPYLQRGAHAAAYGAIGDGGPWALAWVVVVALAWRVQVHVRSRTDA